MRVVLGIYAHDPRELNLEALLRPQFLSRDLQSIRLATPDF